MQLKVVFAARLLLNYHKPITTSSFVFGTKHELILTFYKDPLFVGHALLLTHEMNEKVNH